MSREVLEDLAEDAVDTLEDLVEKLDGPADTEADTPSDIPAPAKLDALEVTTAQLLVAKCEAGELRVHLANAGLVEARRNATDFQRTLGAKYGVTGPFNIDTDGTIVPLG